MTRSLIIIYVLAMALNCLAATHYVMPTNDAAAAPYTNWATAGTNIIDVVNAAMTNTAPRVVWVTNGTYYATNQIYVTNALTLQSVNGRDVTILNGNARIYSNRCMYLYTATSSVIDGFTVMNYYQTNHGTIYVVGGYGNYGPYVPANSYRIQNCLFAGNTNNGITAYGGGIFISIGPAIITNCTFSNNYAGRGGGIMANTIKFLTIEGCRFDGNQGATYGGGGVSISADVGNFTVSNCVIVNNVAALQYGGGLRISTGTGINNKVVSCVITGNSVSGSTPDGGGIHGIGGTGVTEQLSIMNCSIIGNTALRSGGGIWGQNLIIRNCLMAGNRTTNGGGVWSTNTIIESCTIVSNYAKVSGGGVYAAGLNVTGTNNIIYHNTADAAGNFTNAAGNTGLNYSCVFPAVDGTGNITNGPRLIDLAGGNYRLAADSPCINAGLNQDWMTNAVDLDGNRHRRILYGTVDMGAYERINEGTVYGVH